MSEKQSESKSLRQILVDASPDTPLDELGKQAKKLTADGPAQTGGGWKGTDPHELEPVPKDATVHILSPLHRATVYHLQDNCNPTFETGHERELTRDEAEDRGLHVCYHCHTRQTREGGGDD